MKNTLAEIYQNALRKELAFTPGWERLSKADRERSANAMAVVLSHLASLEVPSMEECGSIWNSAVDEPYTTKGIAAVRNAIAAPLVAKIAALEAKLEAVKALPEKWRSKFKGVPTVHVACCIKEIEAALSALTPQAPEIPETINGITWKEMCDELAMAWWYAHKNGWEIQHGDWNNPGVAPHLTFSVVTADHVYHASRPMEAFKKAAAAQKQEAPQHHQPPAGLVLHNPNNLTPEQVGPDHRLGCVGEHIEPPYEWCIDEIPGWQPGYGKGRLGKDWNPKCTIRVPISTPWPEVKAEDKPETWAAEKAAHAKGLRIEYTTTQLAKWYYTGNPTWKEDPDWFYRVAPIQEAEALGNVENPQPSTFEQDGVEWIAHKPGDPCPVDGETRVEIIYQDGAASKNKASAYFWTADDSVPETNIKGYRLISQPEQDKPDALAEKDAEIARLKQACDSMQESVHNQQNYIRSLEEIRERNSGLESQLASARQQIEKLDARYAEDTLKFGALENREMELESRLAALTPRPVSVKPTKEDADRDGFIITFSEKGSYVPELWSSRFDNDVTHWLPGNLARLAPELLPKVEDKERAEMEAAYEASMSDTWRNVSESRSKEAFEKGWFARAGKDSSK